MGDSLDLDLTSLDTRVLEIRRAVFDRLDTLEIDLRSLAGKYEGTSDEAASVDNGPARQVTVAWTLLNELLDYPQAVRRHVDSSLIRASRPTTQAASMREIAKQVVEATSRIQQWFAAMHSSDVPAALEEALAVALDEVDIQDQVGFIAAGNADELDTVVDDARRAIFAETPEPPVSETAERRDKRPVAVFRSPHHEATAPRYWPIVLGHELAHLKLGIEAASLIAPDNERNETGGESNEMSGGEEQGRFDGPGIDPNYLLTRLQLVGEFDFDELERILIEEQQAQLRRKPPTPHLGHGPADDFSGRHTTGAEIDDGATLPIQECLQTANDWVEEVICDLYMVRRFGPAGVAAMANYLTAVGAYVAWTTTHPPGFFRIQMMVDYLGSVPDEMDPVVAPWRKVLAQSPVPTTSPWALQLMTFVSTNFDAIRDFVEGWPGERYEPNHPSRRSAVTLALRQLKFGIPPFSAPVDSFSDQPNNPSWDGDGSQAAGNASGPRIAGADAGSGVRPTQGDLVSLEAADVINAAWLAAVERSTDSGAMHPKVPIDRLVLKSIEILRLLETHPGISAVTPPPAQAAPADGARSGAILGPDEIRRRLSEADHWRRIIVTPRINDHNSAASLDLRLGNRFIVFQRTGISSFNAAQGSSPRAVQRLVERPFMAPFVLHPGEVVLAAALEYVALPRDVGAQVITRSSYGRLGLITATAVQVHPLYRGCLTLELVNLGTVPLTLYPGERVAQLVFFNVHSPDPDRGLASDELFRGSFVCPTAPEFPDVQVDDWIRS